MANRFCVSLTHAKDNSDKATVAFVVANAAVGSGKETLVFLSVEGVRLAQKGYNSDIREEGLAPLGELMENFAKAGALTCLRAVASSGVAVVASLHQVHRATTYADRILALREDRVVEDAPVAGVDARAIEQIYERNGHGATGIGA